MTDMRFALETLQLKNEALHGIWHKAGGSGLTAIHVHGTWGNFYGNPFIVPLASVYDSNQTSFLSPNYPGHDETSVFERLEWFGPALDAWIAKVAPSGPLLLQGHSLGALKLLSYLEDTSSRHKDRVRGLVLLSPFDIVAFYARGKLAEVEPRLKQVQKLRDERGDQMLVPRSMFDPWDISVGAYLNLAVPGGPADKFPTRFESEFAFRLPPNVPTFIALGESDFAAYPSAKDVFRWVSGRPSVETHLIPRAPHNFAGEVDVLASKVDQWVKSQLKGATL